ncbi:MAG: F0F1 ATP synthase subunit epsilon [Proteobacteria bacterium]|nr:F0F1 ATP synthase subunit epsilon [Pseudomonadota bacterium]
MAEPIRLEVVTPDKMVLSEDVDIVVATGTEGEFGVLRNHIPFLTTLQEGELRYRKGGKLEYMAVTGGFAEVLPDKVTVLAEAAEHAREIDIDRAERARERAEKRLVDARREELDHIRAEAALKRALIRLKIARKIAEG